MAEVVTYNTTKIDELTGKAIIDLEINDQGELIATRQGLPPINVGRATPEITITDLMSTTPFYIAHRGSGDEAPEHTIEAYRYAVAAGAKAIEVSVQMTADGVLVCFHDTDMARMTGVTGAVSDFTYAQIKNMIKVKAQDLLGPNWGDCEVPLFRKVLEEFYKNVVIFVEPKSTPATVPLQDILLGLENSTASIVYKSHINATAGLTWANTHGFKTWTYIDPATTSAQMDVVDSITSYWGVPMTATDATISMAVAHSPVKPVIVWEVHRRDQRNAYNALGVKGMMTSGYAYVTRTTAQTKKLLAQYKILQPGNITVGENSPTEALKFFGTNEVGFIQQPNRSCLMGALCPIATPTAYTIKFDMMYPILPAVAEHAGIAFGKVSDDEYQFGSANKTGGYHVLLRGDGDLQLYTHAPLSGTGTQIGAANVSVPDPANPVAGTWMSFNVVVTPTQITVNRTDVAKTFTVTDSSYRGGYFHLLAGNVADATKTARFRNVEVL
jgi:glycerophosphoryl diester phosphodiesterase